MAAEDHWWALTAGVLMIREGFGRGLCPLQTEGHGGVQELIQARGCMMHPCSYSEKELFWEGRTNLPGWLHEPRMREVTPASQGGLAARERKRETFYSCHEPRLQVTMVHCAQGHRVSKVSQLQPMLDPQIRTVNHLSLHIPSFSVHQSTSHLTLNICW